MQHLYHFITGMITTFSIGAIVDLSGLFNGLVTIIGGILTAVILHWLKKKWPDVFGNLKASDEKK